MAETNGFAAGRDKERAEIRKLWESIKKKKFRKTGTICASAESDSMEYGAVIAEFERKLSELKGK